MSQHLIKKNKQQKNNESNKKDLQIDNKNFVYFSDDIRQKNNIQLKFWYCKFDSKKCKRKYRRTFE